MTKIKDKVLGALMGLAVGDCLGVPLEFTRMSDPYMPKVTDIQGGGPFKLPVGAYTDDTSMALCIADSLLVDGFSPLGQMERFVLWRDSGLFSSIGHCFDIGGTVSTALQAFEETNIVYAGDTSILTAGNGSLMRLAPIPMAGKNLKQVQKWAVSMSKTTHGAPQCTQACAFYASLMYMAMNGVSKAELFQYQPAYVTNAELRLVVEGSYKDPQALEWVRGNGYVVNSLEAALWAFWNSTTFEEGAILAVNLGEDTDTTGAVYGQLAGAYYGYDAIPERWKNKIMDRELIEYMGNELFAMGTKDSETSPVE